jgi:glycosyltransferase involved in cell wall biosynthesis
MACQVMVVGARCGAIPEVIGDAGRTFTEGDPADLRAQLQTLLGDTALRMELAQKGRQRVLDHFTQSRIAARTVELYRGLNGASPQDQGEGS